MAQLGKYELIRKIATGGMAELFLARAAGAKGFEKTLVVKRVLPHLTEDPQFTEMFLSEAMLATRLNHQNIVQIFDFGEFEGTYFIAMEYVDGPNLRTLLKHFEAQQKPLPIPECARLVSLASEALAYAHELRDPETEAPLNLIHRDISPDNILLSRTGGVKVVDFGIAKAAVQSHRTSTGVLKGKVAYMSPEHLLRKPVDARTDIYALGVVLYELVTGQKPYDIEGDVAYAMSTLAEPPVPVTTRRPDTPPAIDQIIAKAMAKDPDERYRTCYELHADLEKFLKDCPESVGPLQLAQLAKSVPSTSASLQRSPPVVLATPQPKATPGPSAVTPAPAPIPDAAPAEPMPPKTAVWNPSDEGSPDRSSPASTTQPSGSRRWVRAGIAGGSVLALLLVVALLRNPSVPASAVQPTEPAQSPPPPVPVAPSPAEPPTSVPVPKAPEPVAHPPTGAEKPAANPQEPGRPASPPAKHSPATGKLQPYARPYADVSIDGKPRGTTPMQAISLPPGRYKVVLTNPKDKTQATGDCSVEPNKTTYVKIDWSKPIPARLCD